MFYNIYDFNEKNGRDEVVDIGVKAKAVIEFDFDIDKDFDKVKDIYDIIRQEINLHTNLKIDTSIEKVSIKKKEGLNSLPHLVSLLH